MDRHPLRKVLDGLLGRRSLDSLTRQICVSIAQSRAEGRRRPSLTFGPAPRTEDVIRQILSARKR